MAEELLCTPQQVIDAWPGFANLAATRQASLIAVASDKIARHCRRGFAQEFLTEHHDGKNLPRLWLRRRPVRVVQAVTVDGDALDNTDLTAWTFNPATGELIRGSGLDDRRFPAWFPSGSRNIIVQYWAGYATVPDLVAEAAVKTVRWLWTLDQPGGTGVMQSERIGDYSYSRADQKLDNGLPSHIAVLVQEYVQDEAFV